MKASAAAMALERMDSASAIRRGSALVLWCCLWLLVSIAAAASGYATQRDQLLQKVAGCQLVPEFCQAMTASRADLYRAASIDAAETSLWFLMSAEIALLNAEACVADPAGDVAGPILQTESRYFVLVADESDCVIRDLGERD